MNAATNVSCVVAGGHSGPLIHCGVKELRPHPAYVSSGIAVPLSQLSALIRQGEQAFREPLLITRDRIIIAGYDRWELARHQRPTLPCIEYALSEEEALVWLIQKLRPEKGINSFCRILLALELEPWLKLRAHANQQLGGLRKGSSNLTEADRLDVRAEIAAAAGVSTGNVNKVKQILAKSQPQVIEALRSGELSIHRAWRWIEVPKQRQLVQLGIYRDRHGISRTVHALLRAHRDSSDEELFDAGRIGGALTSLDAKRRESLLIAEVKVPGEVLLLSPALRRILTRQGELIQ